MRPTTRHQSLSQALRAQLVAGLATDLRKHIGVLFKVMQRATSWEHVVTPL